MFLALCLFVLFRSVSWLEEYFSDLCSRMHRKNKDKSQKYKLEGNKYYMASKDKKALQAYTQVSYFLYYLPLDGLSEYVFNVIY